MNFNPHAEMKEDSIIATVGDFVAHLQKNFKTEDYEYVGDNDVVVY